MKTKVEDASIEEIIRDVSCWEDMDTVIMIMPTEEDGQVEVFNYNQTSSVVAPTVKEALIRFHYGLARYKDDESIKLDWSTALEWLNEQAKKR